MPSQNAMIRPLNKGEETSCEEILRSLPQWFGIEDAIVQYVKDLGAMETIVAEMDGETVGFLTILEHNSFTSEIHVMAVREAHHGRGVGRALVERSEELTSSRGTEFLQVKTLGPSHPDENYQRTRGFYERLGYRPLEENRLWGDVNPCLILVKHLSCPEREGRH